MTITLELPDQQAVTLQAKAAAEGLTLEDWLRQLAESAASHSSAGAEPSGSLLEEMRKLRARVKPDPEGWTTRDYVVYGRR